MTPTLRLFDTDSHLFSFTATVLTAAAGEAPHTLLVTLDATAFFPEGGGQYADPGTLGGCPVLDVQEEGGIITHTVSVEGCPDPAAVFAPGASVAGELDAPVRLARMQNHSGEHIVSGIVHRRFGYRNVGFHLSDGEVTLDFDGELTRAQLDEVEAEANATVTACLPVTATYPTPEALAAMTYRAKLELSEGVRIVRVGTPEDTRDLCACCAPHVRNTGEIGLIKLLDATRYKGGVRIRMLCGVWALEDYRRRYTAVAAIAAALSVKQEEVQAGFERQSAELAAAYETVKTLRGRVQELTVAAVAPTEGSLCLFAEGADAAELRHILNRAAPKCGRLCGVFTGNDEGGYRYVIGRGDPALDLKPLTKTVNAALSARGGGSSEMLQGSSTATREEIESFFREF